MSIEFGHCNNEGYPGTNGTGGLGWGVRDLAKKAGVTANTVTRVENGADAKQSTMDSLQQALEVAGVEFINENGGGPGVRLRKRQPRKD